jgi:hypothetical protein
MEKHMRPVPDESLVRRAFRVLEASESPMAKYLREEHTAMIGSARVGMDASRKIFPLELDHIPQHMHKAIVDAHALFEQAYTTLDGIAHHFHGDLVQSALVDALDVEELKREEEKLKVGPTYEAKQAPLIDDARPADQRQDDTP